MGATREEIAKVQALAGMANRARQSQLASQKELLKMKGRFAGLSGEIVSRQDVRRSDPSAKS